MKIDKAYLPQTESVIKARKLQAVLFCLIPSVLLAVAGGLTSFGALVDLLGSNTGPLAGGALLMLSIALFVPAYYVLTRYEEVDFEEFRKLQRKFGRTGPSKEYVNKMKGIGRNKVVRDDVLRLKALYEAYRPGRGSFSAM